MKNWTLCVLGLLALGLLLTLPVGADDTPAAGGEAQDMAAMMAAMEKAAAPGDHHAFLAKMEGDWTYTSKVWMAPGQAPMETGGTSTKSMIMGGRYLREDTQGSMMGTNFDGIATTGYDNTVGEFLGTWIDSMSTAMAIVRGQREGDTLTMHGEYVDPMSGQMMKTRYVVTVVDKDRHTFEYFMTMDGVPEMKSMVMEYARKSGM